MLSATEFDDSLADEWDELVRRSPMGHMLHTRAFLSYHAERFEDASLALRDDRGLMVGVLPAARDGEDLVASHPGATFGGIVHDGNLTGATMLEAIATVWRTVEPRPSSTVRSKLPDKETNTSSRVR